MYHRITATTLFGKSVTFLMPFNYADFIDGVFIRKAERQLSLLPGTEEDDFITELTINEVGR